MGPPLPFLFVRKTDRKFFDLEFWCCCSVHPSGARHFVYIFRKLQLILMTRRKEGERARAIEFYSSGSSSSVFRKQNKNKKILEHQERRSCLASSFISFFLIFPTFILRVFSPSKQEDPRQLVSNPPPSFSGIVLRFSNIFASI